MYVCLSVCGIAEDYWGGVSVQENKTEWKQMEITDGSCQDLQWLNIRKQTYIVDEVKIKWSTQKFSEKQDILDKKSFISYASEVLLKLQEVKTLYSKLSGVRRG